MKLKFKQENDESVFIIGIDDKGNEREVGRIFTPSSSGHNNLNAIQICGFTEAFDLWGCSEYQIPHVQDFGMGIDGWEQAKDIQLMFGNNRKTPRETYSEQRKTFESCHSCFNKPCTCEVKEKFANPYTVKREQDLYLEKKPEDKKD